jgi:hypothetical protein
VPVTEWSEGNPRSGLTRADGRATPAATTATRTSGLSAGRSDALSHRFLNARGDFRLRLLQPSKFGTEHDEKRRRRGRRDRCATASISEDGDLSEEVPRSERCEVCTPRGNDRSASREDEERVASRPLAGESDALAGRVDIEPGSELPEVRVAQRAEEWDGGKVLSADHQAAEPTPVGPRRHCQSPHRHLTITRMTRSVKRAERSDPCLRRHRSLCEKSPR